MKRINKSYGGVAVLEDFSASFEYGKCTAIMGPSGCGKTTLLRILMRLDKEFTGIVEGMPGTFCAVFQEDRLCEEFTVMSNIRMVMGTGDAHGGDKAAPGIQDNNAALIDILTGLGMAEHAGSKVSELSGGQKRRVAIARALMYGADLMIMDEPFKGLDEASMKAAADAIKARKKTVIMVTHSPKEAELMGAEVVSMGHR